MSVVALVCAAGRGAHSSGNDNGRHPVNEARSALVPVAGVPLVVHATRSLLAAGCVDTVLVDVTPGDDDTRSVITDALARHGFGPDVVDVVSVGVSAGAFPVLDADVLLGHEVVHAFVPAEVIVRVVDAVRAGARSVVPVLPCSDTVKRLDEQRVVVSTPDRSGLRVAQAPRGFADPALARAWLAGTPEAEPATVVAGHPDARAIRTPFDIAVAEAALAETGGAR